MEGLSQIINTPDDTTSLDLQALFESLVQEEVDEEESEEVVVEVSCSELFHRDQCPGKPYDFQGVMALTSDRTTFLVC